MADLYLSAELSQGKRLSIAPITSAKLERCIDAPSDTSGYFLTEECSGDPFGLVTILARIEDSEAAFRLGRMFAMT
jgi:hypothetical protein